MAQSAITAVRLTDATWAFPRPTYAAAAVAAHPYCTGHTVSGCQRVAAAARSLTAFARCCWRVSSSSSSFLSACEVTGRWECPRPGCPRACTRTPCLPPAQDTQPYPLNYGMAPRAVGCPMGCPAGCPVGVGAPISYGYSGYGAAGGAAAGFAGGVLVSEMMHASHHRHDYYDDRYDGPSYVDSRSTCGGDSFYDGGDSGFAADS